MYFSGENSICGTIDEDNTLFKISKRLTFDAHHEFAALDYVWSTLPIQWWSIKPLEVRALGVNGDVFGELVDRLDEPEALEDDTDDLFDIDVDKLMVDMLCVERVARVENAIHASAYIAIPGYAAQLLGGFHNLMANRVTHYDAHSENVITSRCSEDLVFVYEPLKLAIPTLGSCNHIIDFATCYTPSVDTAYFTSPLVFVNSNYLTYRYDALTDLRTSMIQLVTDLADRVQAQPLSPLFESDYQRMVALYKELVALNRQWDVFHLERHSGRIETGLASKEEYVELLLKEDNSEMMHVIQQLVNLLQSHIPNREYSAWAALYNAKTRSQVAETVNAVADALKPFVDECHDRLSQTYFCRTLVKNLTGREGDENTTRARDRFESLVMLEFGTFRSIDEIPKLDFARLHGLLGDFVEIVEFLLAREIVENERVYDNVRQQLGSDPQAIYEQYAAVIAKYIYVPPTNIYTKFCFSSNPHHIIAVPNTNKELLAALNEPAMTAEKYYATLMASKNQLVPIESSAEYAMSLFP
ncbi:hypothetical protein SARC_00108 [Sphaeroforma arctica JP610]|uniref:Uncharacterized protein n=1 Tax=Sphaeroforma arctica JP610 TaxID=667725 RepID=A0A0L0GG88_9EUKA|nr:hypothetical protein SARC_00108 [Sphaeroforma arctica JP610]KNC87851.1 hypothetical protein SARC_00108 [Sphaeroforma arctica JP610]|eukprot:XP_014161753.1 hypothetical protein SARC_00108 [Sphaeroforma arctica JP610]